MLTLAELTNFINNIFLAYDGYLFFSFTLMMAGSVMVLVRRLFVGYKQ